MNHLPLLAARFFDTPLLVSPERAAIVHDVLASRIGGEVLGVELPAPEASRFRGSPVRQNGDGARLYQLDNGVALVPVLGELVNRGAWVGASSGLTSYEGIDASLRAAIADINVRAIVLDMNSPGGEASGALETGALVRELDKQKPIYAFVNGQAASAAYAIASGARKIVAAPSAVLGSIGVVLVHRDVSAAAEKQGVKTTIIHAGAYKADASPYRALPDDARARIQGHVDAIYDLFTGMVAAHRGLDAQAVRDMEAGIYLGANAVAAGLADAIGTLDDVFAMVRRSNVSPGSPSQSGGFMTETSNGAVAASTGITQATVDAAAASARADGHAAGLAEGVASERARVAAILGHAEAEGRGALAHHLAFKTGVSPDDAAATLAAAPKTDTRASRLAGVVPNPTIGADTGAGAANDAGKIEMAWGAIVSDINSKAGHKA